MKRGRRFSNLVSSYNTLRTSVVNGRSMRSGARSTIVTGFAIHVKNKVKITIRITIITM
jgi:hypothetical protein